MLVLIILSILTILTFCFSVAGRLAGNVQIHFELIILIRGAFLGISRFMFAIGKCKIIRVSLCFSNGEGALWEMADVFKSL